MPTDRSGGTAAGLAGKVVLLTGGTGSFGKAFVAWMLANTDATVRIYSRDELKQYELIERFGTDRIRPIIGDVRDGKRLIRAAHGADVIVHAAAMKQVPACEYNPFEAVQTNVLGAQNVVDAAIDTGVTSVVALSTDKAVNPVNLYGATKLCAEKIIVQGNAYASGSATTLSCVRYGNVMGSRGSVIPLFMAQRETGLLTITDERMTRFWIGLDGAIELVLHAIGTAQGGEVFVPKIPSMKLTDLAEAVAPGVPRKVIGIRPGEKLHEVLITHDESRHTLDAGDHFVILPEHPWWSSDGLTGTGIPVEDGWAYRSDTNTQWMEIDELRHLLARRGA